ncbi:MAG: UTP--glucose-1-phosphate uridylyltransferase [Planctomycetota bacterium]|nr:UTP--glucose-1-phosphate uridylyltransferase [Planctomycetota bacterium]MDP6941743.1 UTP--glucose-1-phosphate uridylyltransferase [Planctomycetota bacterium]
MISSDLLEALQGRGLEAVLEPAQKLGNVALKELEQDLASIHWPTLDRQLEALKKGGTPSVGKLAPPPLAPPSTIPSHETQEASQMGWNALKEGRIALCTVAGGQASRLGFDAPKGAYPLGSVSGASLFQGMAGQVALLRKETGIPIPWIIQTGPGNHEDTIRFFSKRAFFGLSSSSIHFICQGTLPALSLDGQLLLATPTSLFRNPDGHGGFYAALHAAGTFKLLREKGIDTLFYCQVDNPLVRMGDPAFLGHHLKSNAQMSIKVVEKTDPEEKVGLVALVDGTPSCIEYSDLAPELAKEKSQDGGLLFRAGNIAIHAFALDFAESCATHPLELHLAHKKLFALDGGMQPVERDGVKFETFVFDALTRADEVVVQMCERDEEFAPVKNRVGQDSIRTSREALDSRNRNWISGSTLPSFNERKRSEILPGIALCGESLLQKENDLSLIFRNSLLIED